MPKSTRRPDEMNETLKQVFFCITTFVTPIASSGLRVASASVKSDEISQVQESNRNASSPATLATGSSIRTPHHASIRSHRFGPGLPETRKDNHINCLWVIP